MFVIKDHKNFKGLIVFLGEIHSFNRASGRAAFVAGIGKNAILAPLFQKAGKISIGDNPKSKLTLDSWQAARYNRH
ncbi:hypothetical protein [Kiloniella laminariae]|uniref:hypothetical protein n=1 Tax=Kiloniella laminariae TaxID=454162 RepID=UPI0003642EBA|nr:hypothetical protein [Kiloniella laminariae]